MLVNLSQLMKALWLRRLHDRRQHQHCLGLGDWYLDLQRTDDRNHDGAQYRSSEAVVEVFAIVLNAAMHSRCLLGSESAD